MEILFNKTKKILVILLLAILLTSVSTPIFAASPILEKLKARLSSKTTNSKSIFSIFENTSTNKEINIGDKISVYGILGDVDRNGKIEEKDAQLVLKYVSGKYLTSLQRKRADVNQDGQITAVDSSLIMQYAANIVNPTGINLNKTTATLEVNGTVQLTATVTPSNATNKTVTWTSNNTSVATVSNGNVTAKKAGEATITAKTSNGKTATCKVTVNKPAEILVTGITLNKTTATLEVNGTVQLTATVTPSDATNKTVTWTSSDTSVATVSDGKVTAKKAGTAIITAKSNNDKMKTCTITVTDPYIYTFGGKQYKIAVTSTRLNNVVNKIADGNIGQKLPIGSGTGNCIHFATYHNYMLFNDYYYNNAKRSNVASAYSTLNVNGNKGTKVVDIDCTSEEELFKYIGICIDQGYPVRLKTNGKNGDLQHYVTVVGYTGSNQNITKDELLIIGSSFGHLFAGNSTADYEKCEIKNIHSDKHIDAYNVYNLPKPLDVNGILK